ALAQHEGTPEETLRLRIAALARIERSQVVENGRHLRMARALRSLGDDERPAAEPPGGGELALAAIELGEVRERGREADVVRAEALGFLSRRDPELLRFGVVAL